MSYAAVPIRSPTIVAFYEDGEILALTSDGTARVS
jgi:hypothetical protein